MNNSSITLFFLLFLSFSYANYPDFIVFPTTCTQHSDCPSLRYSRCDNNQCKPCSEHSHCNHLTRGGSGNCRDPESGSRYCRINCDHDDPEDEDNEFCRRSRGYCAERDSGDRCLACGDTDDCKNQGYASSVWCDKTSVSGLAICNSCPQSGGCPNGGTCQYFRCIGCTSDTYCQGLNQGTPYCYESIDGKKCAECADHDDCQDPAKSKCDKGQCVRCDDDDYCGHISGGKDRCKESVGCVECKEDGHCSGTKDHCWSNICVECKDSGDCGGGKNYCSDSKVCVACKEDNHCGLGDFCVDGVCVDCKAHSNCGSPGTTTPVCSPTYTCASCKTDPDVCAVRWPAQTICLDSGKCVECETSDDCDQSSNKPVCSAQNKCVECKQHSDCNKDPTKPRCDGPTNSCQACQADGSFCFNLGIGKNHCAGSGACVQCLQPLNCGGSGMQCIDNICAQCGNKDHCTDVSAPYCSAAKTCTGCPNSDFCAEKYPGQLPFCLDGTCVQCIDECPGTKHCSGENKCVDCLINTDCLTAANPVCILPAGTCGSCAEFDGICATRWPSEKRACHETTGACVQCTNGEDTTLCTGETPHCSGGNVCVKCTDHSHCSGMTPRCSGNTCVSCGTDANFCSSQPGLPDHCAGTGACVACTAEGHCTGGTHCDTDDYTCKACLDETHCSDVSAPYCNVGLNVCEQCPSSEFCLDKYDGDLSFCVGGSCVECTSDEHCTSDAASYCLEGGNVCVACTQNSECLGYQEPICNVAGGSYTCESCTSDAGVCAERFPEKPVCSGGECVECATSGDCDSGSAKPECLTTSKVCVECTDDDHCEDASKPDCSSETNACQPCLNSDFCLDKYGAGGLSHCLGGTCVECLQSEDCQDPSKPHCFENACTAIIYEPQCKPTYNIQMTQNSDNLNQFDFYFPSALASKVDIKGEVTLTLVNIPTTDYSYTLMKVTNTHYQAIFAIQTSIPTTQMRLKMPCPSQPGYIFGDIVMNFPTKRMPFTTAEIQETVETIKNLASTATNVMAGASGSMMLAGANPAIMWALIGLLQTFYYMIFINVQYPVNLQAFFGLFTLGNLSFIPNPIGWFFPNIENESLDAPYKFVENEVDGLFLQTAGNMLLMWFLVIVGYIASKLFLKFTRNMPKLLGTIAAKTVEIFEWSGVIRTLITSYTQISMTALLQIKVLNFDSKLFGVSSVTGVGFALFTFAFPPAMILLIRKYSKSPLILKAKYSTLTEEFKYKEGQYMPLYFNAFFVLRRLAMTLTLVFLHDYPYMEVLLLILNCVVWTVLLLNYTPYNNRINNVVNILSEILFVGIHIVIFLFAHDDSIDWLSEKEKLDLGWIVIGCCGVILALTLIASFVEQYYAFKSMILLLIKVIKGKKQAPKMKRKSSPQIHPQKPAELSRLESNNTTRDHLENSMSTIPSGPAHRLTMSSQPQLHKRHVRRRPRGDSEIVPIYLGDVPGSGI